MRDNNTIRGIVAQILSKGEFPEGAFELRDISNVKSFELVSDERVRFRIKHRLGLFDHIFQKDSLSAYIPKTYVFELDISTEKVNLIEQIEGEPVIHFKLLAIEEVEKCFELYQVHDRKFKKTNFEKDVIENAERELASIINGDDFANDIQKATEGGIIPEDSFDRFLTEFKEQYISKMIHQWKIYKNLQGLI